MAINEVAKTNVYVSKTTGESHHTSFYGYECMLNVTDSEKLTEMLKMELAFTPVWRRAVSGIGVQHV